jgi:hypothetical protein
METAQYHDAVVANRREHDFEAIDAQIDGFDTVWEARDDDATVGAVRIFATLVDDDSVSDPDDIVATADEFRDVLVAHTADGDRTTPLGYIVFAVPAPDPSIVEAAKSYTVAQRRTNVFPLVYDCEAETLHRHEVPRLKGRGIYKRQAADVERLFDV